MPFITPKELQIKFDTYKPTVTKLAIQEFIKCFDSKSFQKTFNQVAMDASVKGWRRFNILMSYSPKFLPFDSIDQNKFDEAINNYFKPLGYMVSFNPSTSFLTFYWEENK